jgi:hypothetical protein
MIGIDDSAYKCVQGLKIMAYAIVLSLFASFVVWTMRGEDKRQVNAAYEKMLREEAIYTAKGQPRPEGDVTCWRVGGK